jgi:hypothetical protein
MGKPHYISESRVNEKGQMFNCRITQTDKGWLVTCKREGRPIMGLFTPMLLSPMELETLARASGSIARAYRG